MKNLLIAFFCFFSINVFAQVADNAVDKHVEKVANLYNLDKTQIEQYRQITIDKNKEVTALKTNKTSVDSAKTKMDAINKGFEKKVLAILNDEQKELFLINQRMINSLRNNQNPVKNK